MLYFVMFVGSISNGCRASTCRTYRCSPAAYTHFYDITFSLLYSGIIKQQDSSKKNQKIEVEFQCLILRYEISVFFTHDSCWAPAQGQKFKKKCFDSSILTSLGNIFCKKLFFVAPTQEAVGGGVPSTHWAYVI